MNRRKFLSYVGCSCCGLVLNSCATAPITDRRQLKIIPESKLNAQAAAIFEKVKNKEKMSSDSASLNEITNIGDISDKFQGAIFKEQNKFHVKINKIVTFDVDIDDWAIFYKQKYSICRNDCLP